MPNLDSILGVAITDLGVFLGAEAGVLFLRDAEQDGVTETLAEPETESDAGAAVVLTCRVCSGAADFTGAVAASDEGVLGYCMEADEPTAIEVVAANAGFPSAVATEADFDLRTVLCAPLRAGDTCLGVVALLNKRGRPTFEPEDRNLLQAAASTAASAITAAHLAEVQADQDRVGRELELAADIQRNLLPKSDPKNFPVIGINHPIREVSGDFFDFFRRANGHIPFALGDVSGKGMNAALLMAKTASLFRCLGKSIDDPAALLKILNREIYETSSRGMFVTMVAGIYEPWTGRLRFANAGHEPPLLRRVDRSYETFPAEEPPLGILPDLSFVTHEINIDNGEFFVFSDGLTEYRYGESEQLGVEGLIQLVEASTEQTLGGRLNALLAELDLSGWELRDDLTVLAIDGAWVWPETYDAPVASLLTDAAPDALFELRLPARSDRLKLLRPGIHAAARMCDFGEEDAQDIVLAVSEACQNVVLHAYNGDSDGDLVIEVYRRDDGILVRLRDFAPPVDVSRIGPRDLDDLRPGGLGTHFIREIMDSAEFLTVAAGGGNVLEMTKRTR